MGKEKESPISNGGEHAVPGKRKKECFKHSLRKGGEGGGEENTPAQ